MTTIFMLKNKRKGGLGSATDPVTSPIVSSTASLAVGSIANPVSRILMFVSVLAFGLLSYTVLSSILYPSISSHALSDAVSSEVGVNVREFIKLALDTSSLALADSSGHTTISPAPASSGGTEITGEVNVAVTTNTTKGYTLSVFTQDHTKSMTHSNPAVPTAIESIDTVSGYDATSGASSLSNNTWGFRRHLAGGYSNWFAVGENESTGTIIDSPNEDDAAYCEDLAYQPSDPSNPDSPKVINPACASSTYSTYAINFGARLTSELPAGTYTNNVVFSAVAKSEGTKYTMNFNANGGSNTMGPRTVLAGSTMTLPSTGFAKEGMGIKGWAFQAGVTPETANTSAATTMYNAGQAVAINDLIASATAAGQTPATTSSFTVYAVWETVYSIAFDKNTSDATGNMSEATNLLQSASYTVPSGSFTRSGYIISGWALSPEEATVYSVGDSLTVAALVTAAQTAGQDITIGISGTVTLYAKWAEASMQAASICSKLPERTTSTLKDVRDNQYYTVYRWPTTGAIGGYPDGYPSNMAGFCIMTKDLSLGYVTGGSITKGGNLTLSTSTSASSGTITARASSSNWSSTNSDSNLQYINGTNATYGTHSYYSAGAAQKVCPKGWRPPTNAEHGYIISFIGGNNATGSSNIRSAPYNFVYGGLFYTGGWSGISSSGIYWSSTQDSGPYGYYLSFDSSNLAIYGNAKNFGFSVRCVASN